MKRVSVTKCLKELNLYLHVYATGYEVAGIEKAIQILEKLKAG